MCIFVYIYVSIYICVYSCYVSICVSISFILYSVFMYLCIYVCLRGRDMDTQYQHKAAFGKIKHEKNVSTQTCSFTHHSRTLSLSSVCVCACLCLYPYYTSQYAGKTVQRLFLHNQSTHERENR